MDERVIKVWVFKKPLSWCYGSIGVTLVHIKYLPYISSMCTLASSRGDRFILLSSVEVKYDIWNQK